VLQNCSVEIAEERSARRAPLDEAEARRLLEQVDTVVIARGRAVRRMAAGAAEPRDLEGPTGNYRAPLLRRGGTLLVGYHPEALEELLGH
jgi:hypothetical protein